MSEEKPQPDKWLPCPSNVKKALPAKIKQAVGTALDECMLEIVGNPAAQREKWVYKEIKSRICKQMQEWVKEAIDEAMAEVLDEEK